MAPVSIDAWIIDRSPLVFLMYSKSSSYTLSITPVPSNAARCPSRSRFAPTRSRPPYLTETDGAGSIPTTPTTTHTQSIHITMRMFSYTNASASLLLLLLLPLATVARAAPAEAEAAAAADKARAKAPVGVALMHNRLELNSLSFEELDAIFQEGTIDVRVCAYLSRVSADWTD